MAQKTSKNSCSTRALSMSSTSSSSLAAAATQDLSAVVTVTRNAAGKARHLMVNHRPRSSVLLFARVIGEKYAGTPLAKYFIASESPRPLGRP